MFDCRLLDFSSLTAKRKPNESNHIGKTNGTSVQAIKPNKKQKKDDLLDILEQSNKTEDSDSGSDVSPFFFLLISFAQLSVKRINQTAPISFCIIIVGR